MEGFVKYRPKFGEGVILKAEKMNELVNHAFDLPDLLYTGYTTGIISGLDMKVEDNFINISKGVFLYEQEVYTLSKDIKIEYHPTNIWHLFKNMQKRN